MDAREYNEKVWGSDNILRARACLARAQRELEHDSKGWGTMPLNAAKEQLRLAQAEIEEMLNWANALDGGSPL